jgi:FtsP/CotA-like multicopper oxidase with cupredoxin domain
MIQFWNLTPSYDTKFDFSNDLSSRKLRLKLATFVDFQPLYDSQARHFMGKVTLLYGDADFLTQFLDSDATKRLPFRADFFAGGDNSQPSPEFKGQVICVNGKIWPYVEVEPRPYRFRFINGSNSRMYVLRVSDAATDRTQPDINALTATLPIYQIGADGGLFDRAVLLDGTGVAIVNDGITSLKSNSTNFLVLAPGERADLLIDFAGQ